MSSEKEPGFLLSILIPTMPVRAAQLQRLMAILTPQLSNDIEVIIDIAMGMSIGVKRQAMLEVSKGKYVCFIDDDDRISDDYVALLREGMAKDVDCCSLDGIITTNGENAKVFRHSLQYTSMYEQNDVYFRPPNHLNCVKREHAIKIGYVDMHRGEDSQYCIQLMGSGLLKTEYFIPRVIYYYLYDSNKPTFYR